MKFILIFIVSLFPFQVFADELNAPFEQTDHRVFLKLKNTLAKVRVERSFQNNSRKKQQLELLFSLPTTAVITNLKSFEGGVWRKAKTIQSEEASNIYGVPNKKGKSRGKTSVLLTKISLNGTYSLIASPIVGKTSFRITYDVEIPFDYKSGLYHFSAKSLFGNLPGTKPIILKTKDRFMFRNVLREPGVTYSIFQNECEKMGAPSHCEIREIEIPFLKKPIFSAQYESKKQSLSYLLVPPGSLRAGNPSRLKRSWKSKPTKTVIEERLSSEVGKWRFVVWSDGKGTGTLKEIKIVDDKDVYLPTTPNGIELPEHAVKDSSNIIVLNAKDKKTKIGLGKMRFDGREYVSINIDAARRLSEIPDSPSLIFVIDTSISQGYLGVIRQINIARSITQHFPKFESQVVSYSRYPQKTTSLEAFIKDFRNKPNSYLANGSNFDAALGFAAQIEKKMKKGPVLIYAMTDLYLKKSYALSDFLTPLETLKETTTVHLLNVHEVEGSHSISVRRDKSLRFAEMASSHHGVATHVSIPSVYQHNVKTKDIETRYLARPDRLDEVEILSKNISLDPNTKPFLMEGERLQLNSGWGVFKNRIRIKAKLWNKEIIFSAQQRASENRSALLFYLASDKTTKLKKVAARLTKVVSMGTSFYLEGRANRKITQPFQKSNSFNFKSDEISSELLGMGRGLFVLQESVFSKTKDKCRRKGKVESFRVTLETVLFEIVDVGKGSSAFSKCIAEGIWNTVLPSATKTGNYTFEFFSDGTVK